MLMGLEPGKAAVCGMLDGGGFKCGIKGFFAGRRLFMCGKEAEGGFLRFPSCSGSGQMTSEENDGGGRGRKLMVRVG